MKARELRDLDREALKGKLDELKTELFNLRFQQAVGQLGNPMRIRQVRRDIARVLTVMREQELGGRGQSARTVNRPEGARTGK
ncbi:MAG: 50S ribosomal protein L29 [Limnochordaceae bacterium]|uniref:Large ribosomal subunit protein uL29 n=1 Tax=Carboxydichorda subterranea TaxID=3109565 RepID=A0ABZ1BYD1_9FIRM|nr:50S ribosomal protein L29 [Limnochorda sp. L945t]MBE3599027.1 50S ribosomal protein L29 [Limnochordaceae bacterium]WRP17723.1 50S ribosomal protein L29 [Limnochorda sp. L945t]